MAINFPASPSNGDTYSYSGKTWTYDGTATKWEPTNILSDVTATATELNYVDGVTSAIQTQLDAKGTVSSLADLSVTATATEINYLDGVTSAVQTQLDAKGTVSSLADLSVTATATEINYLDGVTSPIQAQLNSVGGGEVEVWAYVTMSGSTPTLQNDVGVSSIADQGVGTFRVNMSVTRTSQYYALSGSAWSDEFAQMRPEATSPTTRFWVYWINDAGALTDPNFSWSVMSAGEN